MNTPSKLLKGENEDHSSLKLYSNCGHSTIQYFFGFLALVNQNDVILIVVILSVFRRPNLALAVALSGLVTPMLFRR